MLNTTEKTKDVNVVLSSSLFRMLVFRPRIATTARSRPREKAPFPCCCAAISWTLRNSHAKTGVPVLNLMLIWFSERGPRLGVEELKILLSKKKTNYLFQNKKVRAYLRLV